MVDHAQNPESEKPSILGGQYRFPHVSSGSFSAGHGHAVRCVRSDAELGQVECNQVVK